MLARIRAAWKQRQEKRRQELIDRKTYEAAERQRESQREARTFPRPGAGNPGGPEN